MKSYFFLIIYIFFIAHNSQARNSGIASTFNQWVNKDKACFKISEEEFTKAGYKCGMGNPTSKEIVTNWEVFEWLVFQKSAENQILKNKCLDQQLEVLLKDPKRLDDWVFTVATAWIGYKQAELLSNYCRRRLDEGYDVEAIAFIKPAPVKLGECSEDRYFQLNLSKELFQLAIPIISKSSFIKIIEKYRGNITIDNKEFSDSQIIEHDLDDLGKVNINTSEALKKSIREELLSFKKDRIEVDKNIRKSKNKNGRFVLDEDLQDFIYNDGTVQETLNELGLSSSKGEMCMSANFEPSLSGSLFDFAFLTVAGGGAWGALFRGTRLLATATKFQMTKSALGKGLTLSTANLIGKEIADACPNPFGKKNQNHLSKKTEKNYSAWTDIKFKDEEVPACKKLEVQNYKINELYNNNCGLTILINLMPF
ncbi:MAG: hypothetical protein H6625_13395 [Bdellovibrionaceae bacterium]|nr:hypothetical protein [Pseudobdellovibrionaceae bacterium]